ncbi:aminomethyl-transferring glycine dehydrogenase subunit GcvPB [Candidatus Proelusimicrobium volucris]|uniref:aminomethyl-transferring glycine dehydrogenase subunit GcvPB n=1 Tax=Candidatus Proelusimicrobium volucris TaxID=3416225 RepID=UPI003D13A8BA
MNNYPHNLLSIEKSSALRRGVQIRKAGKRAGEYLDGKFLRSKPPLLPSMSEFDTVRHFTNLSRLNFCLDTHFYPLGSCTMKYNPKAYDVLSGLDGFSSLHPYCPEDCAQGTLSLIYGLEEQLKQITGLAAFTLQPAAGAHGEFTGALIARAYHKDRKDFDRSEIIIPDTAHGTNPATAAMAGCKVVNVKSAPDGRVDLEELKKVLGPKTALVMLTIPNTVGLFEKDIKEISRLTHEAGALLYMDGANLNALIGLVKPADMGVDIMHINLHKTIATPHGGGGPGAGAVGVCGRLADFLPVPKVIYDGKKYKLESKSKKSIGKVKSFYGNISVLIRAYCYLRQFDGETLKEIARGAVLNANYVRVKLAKYFPAYFDEVCMHECVLTIDKGVLPNAKTLDVAKMLLDMGFHAPTIYFPLIVPEAIMVEPTETENKQTLDKFISAMTSIFLEAGTNPDVLHEAPKNCPVKRIDEVSAAREPNLRW